jgi:hypothetical protein
LPFDQHTSLRDEFVLPCCVILWVHEPFIGEKLSNVWHIFFIEITDCASVPEFSMHQHVEPTVMAVIEGDIKMVVLVKKWMLLKKQ